MKLLIHAPNVHQGGGRTLLLALLASGKDRDDVYAVIDARLQLPPEVPDSCILGRVSPTPVARLAAEWRLRSLQEPGDVLLCFGNLPPLFGAPGRTVLFVQNRYLLRRRAARGLPFGVRLRMAVERVWLRKRLGRVHQIFVQTESMAREVHEELGVKPAVVPYAGTLQAPAVTDRRPFSPGDQARFLYVASGEPHKNHRNLLEAWRLLAEDGIHPSLCLTVSREEYPALCGAIDASRAGYGLKVDNVGHIQTSALADLYRRCSALIYPSAFESFGLPLLEAAARGLPVIAAELDYVRDVIDPLESFDSQSPVSIARAVRRFLGRGEPRAVILTPEEFIEALLADVGGRT